MPQNEIIPFGTNGLIFGYIIHEEKSDRTCVILYANAANDSIIRESRIVNTTIKQKNSALKDELQNIKNDLLDRSSDQNTRKSIVNNLFKKHDHTEVHYPETTIQLKVYSRSNVKGSTCYKRYFLPGNDHRVNIELKEHSSDKLLFEYHE